MFIVLIFYIAVVVLMVASMWTLFEKAGKPGWACIVPIYSAIVMLEIAGKPWWWLLLMLVPVVNIVIAIWSFNLFIKSYGKTETYTVLCLLLGVIFIPMLAFDKNTQYVGPAGNGYNKNELY